LFSFVKRVQGARKSGKQGVLLEMAQSWIRLAEQAKERDDPNKRKRRDLTLS
jgi:hypothetical protein